MRYTVLAALLLAGCGGVSAPTTSGAPAGDACGALAHQGLVGMDAAQSLILPEPKRVFRTDEAVTTDFNAARLNVQLDTTDTIIAVTCG